MSINPKNQEILNDYEYYLDMELNDNESKRKNTVKSYYGDAVQFLEYLGEIDCVNAKMRDANEWLKSLVGRDGGSIKAASRNKKLAGLKCFYNYLIEVEGITENNPFKGLKAVKIKKGETGNQITRDFLEKDEIDRLKKVLEKEVKSPTMKRGCNPTAVKMNALRNRAIIFLMLSSGMRVEEVCRLQWHEIKISEDGTTAKINIPIEKDKGKRGRSIPIPVNVCKYIEEYENSLIFKRQNDLVFVSQNGNKLLTRDIASAISEYVNMAGIDDKNITPHSLRHTFGTHMVNNPKYSMKAIATIMGHSSTKQLEETYYHVSEEINDVIFKI